MDEVKKTENNAETEKEQLNPLERIRNWNLNKNIMRFSLFLICAGLFLYVISTQLMAGEFLWALLHYGGLLMGVAGTAFIIEECLRQ